MGDFDPVAWETIEAAVGPPAAAVVERVDRVQAEVADAEPYAAVRAIHDSLAEDPDVDTIPGQGGTMWWLAIQLGVHWALVQFWLYEDGIPIRERNLPADVLEQIRAHRDGEQ